MSTDTSPAIELRGASKIFKTPSGGLHTAVRELDLTIGRGEFVAVVGPTGCGKSTTLTLVSGLEEPTEGEVLVTGEPVAGVGDKVGFVFQQDATFPWRTVLSNVMAGPRFRGVPKAEARIRAREWLARVGLTAFEDRYPHQLSGGQRKRVALAATFVNDPEILLMDEPFSALDVQTRALMSDELLELWEGTGASVVFVTHDLEESIALAEEGATQVFFPERSNDIILGAVGVLQFDVVASRLKEEYKVECSYEPITVYSARWIECSDKKKLEEFTNKAVENLALDGGGHLTYLAPTRVNLALMEERWPDVKFRATREHH